jgi:hypothetical protein
MHKSSLSPSNPGPNFPILSINHTVMNIWSLIIMNIWSFMIMDLPTLVITKIWSLIITNRWDLTIKSIWSLIWVLARRLYLKLHSILNKWPYLQLLSNIKPDKQGQLRIKPRRNQLEQRRKRKTFPFLSLPLELRIMIYDHAISDQEHNITDYNYNSRKKSRFLPSFLHATLQITREIYQFCPITAIIDVAIPNQMTRNRHHARRHNQWQSTTLAKELQHHFHIGYHTHVTISRMLVANAAVRRFGSIEGRKGVIMKVRVRCLGCKGGCRGLTGLDGCWECYWFPLFNSWNMGSLRLLKKDLLFEFC